MNRRRAGKLAASLALSAFFLVLFFRGVDLGRMGRAIASARPLPLLGGLAAGLVAYWLRAWRWQWILRGLGRVPIASTYHATTIGYAASVVLPLKAGEVIRPLLLARWRSLPASGALASVLVERMLDLVAILGLFLFAVFVPKGLGADPRALAGMTRAGSIILLGLAASIAGLLLLAIFRERFLAATIGRASFLPEPLRRKLEEFARHCLEGFAALRSPSAGGLILLQSLAVWLVIDVQIASSLAAFRFDLPFRSTFVIAAFGALGLALGTPGGVGGFHKTTQFSVELYGVAPDPAAAFAVVHHAACFLPQVALGLLSLVLVGMSWGSVSELARDEQRALQ